MNLLLVLGWIPFGAPHSGHRTCITNPTRSTSCSVSAIAHPIVSSMFAIAFSIACARSSASVQCPLLLDKIVTSLCSIGHRSCDMRNGLNAHRCTEVTTVVKKSADSPSRASADATGAPTVGILSSHERTWRSRVDRVSGVIMHVILHCGGRIEKRCLIMRRVSLLQPLPNIADALPQDNTSCVKASRL